VAADPGPAVKAGAAGAKGNVLTRKIGPLPGWAWAALGIGGFYLWKKHQASTAAASTAATTASTGDNGAALPTSDTTAPSGYAYQGPGVGDGATGTLPSGARTHHHGSGVAATSPNTLPASPTTAQTFYNTGPTGTTTTVNPATLAAPAQSNDPGTQAAEATTSPYTLQTPTGPVQTTQTTYGPATISNQAIANQGLLESLGYTPAQVAAMEAQ
jgi:hypothetical protein